MAIKGTIAKQNFTNKMKEVFGSDFVGEFDKKIYVNIDDGGEMVQLAISLTCPKTPITTVNEKKLNYNTGIDFTADEVTPVAPDNVEISNEERERVRELMKRMGL